MKIEWSLDDDDKNGQYFSPGCDGCPPPVASVHKDGAGKMDCVSIIPTLKQISPSISLLSGCRLKMSHFCRITKCTVKRII